jgi:two-component system LytT family response regulator
MQYRTLVVDDEPTARRRLKRFLSTATDLNIVGECADGKAAVAAIREKKPDLVFLDVQMPEMSGFEVLREIKDDPLPVVVFVTAFDEFALRAFEAQALDYVLKPFGERRIQQALERARVHLQGRSGAVLHRRLANLLACSSPSSNFSDRLLVKSEGRVLFLKPTEIDWVEAVGDYLKLHLAAESHMVRATMSEMEKRLDAAGFARIHRSRLVNLDRVKEVRPVFDGESIVVLKNGTRLGASRAGLKDLKGLLGL